MFVKTLVAGLLLTGAALAHEQTQQEREQNEMEVTKMEKAVNSSQDDIESALSKMKDYKQSLSKEWNVNTTRDTAQQFVKQARTQAEADAETLKGRFLTAHQSAHDEGSKLQQAAGQFNNDLTAAQSQALQQAIQNSEKNMDHQINLMSTNVKGIRKLNSQMRHDAKHQLAKLQSGYRSKAKQLKNNGFAAIKGMKRNSIALERAERNARHHEQTFEDRYEHNEKVWEHHQRHVEDLDDQLRDQIEHVGKRIEHDMEDELDEHDQAIDSVLKDLEAKRRDAMRMADTARRSVATAEHQLLNQTGHQKSQDTFLTLASRPQEENWGNAQALAMVAGILGGVIGFLVVDRLRQRRHEGAVPLLD